MNVHDRVTSESERGTVVRRDVGYYRHRGMTIYCQLLDVCWDDGTYDKVARVSGSWVTQYDKQIRPVDALLVPPTLDRIQRARGLVEKIERSFREYRARTMQLIDSYEATIEDKTKEINRLRRLLGMRSI